MEHLLWRRGGRQRGARNDHLRPEETLHFDGADLGRFAKQVGQALHILELNRLDPRHRLEQRRELLHLLGRQRRPPCDGTESVEFKQFGATIRQQFRARRAQVYIILQAHPAPARKIDPRLDGHHRVQRQDHLVGL